MSMRIAPLALLVVVMGLVACGSGPSSHDSGEPVAHFNPAKDPYWLDPRWDKALVDAIQSVVHDPVDPTGTATPGLHATVKFTFLDGVIEYPEITASTGNPDLDKLMLHQVASAQVPRPTGIGTDQPHEFELDLEMPTAFESFQEGIYAAIDARKIYPKDAIISGSRGSTTVGFDYLDGKASNIAVAKSSGNKDLDKASVVAVTKANLPPPPSVYAGKILHMEPVFCYNLEGPGKCPVRADVILIYGTRIR
jgi:TonB family protein